MDRYTVEAYTLREGGGLSRGCWIAVYSRALLTL